MRQPKLDIEPLLLTGGEVAQMLGCSPALAYRWMSAGVLPTLRIPGSRSVRVPKARLLEWIQLHTAEPRNGMSSVMP